MSTGGDTTYLPSKRKGSVAETQYENKQWDNNASNDLESTLKEFHNVRK